MKFFKAAIVIACTVYPPASCFAKDVAPVGDRATADVIQEEVQLVVINSSGGGSVAKRRASNTSVKSTNRELGKKGGKKVKGNGKSTKGGDKREGKVKGSDNGASDQPSDQPSGRPSVSLQPSDQPSDQPSGRPSVSLQPSVFTDWRAAATDEVYEALPTGDNGVIDLTSSFAGSSEIIEINFDYNWFGETFSSIELYREGDISLGQDQSYIDFVYSGTYLDPSEGGSVKYLVNSSPSSLKISFEDVPFEEGGGFVQAQIELFETGDVLICYGEGDIPAGEEILAGIYDNDSTPGVNYPITDDPFDSFGETSVWPANKCWKFVMPE